MATESPWTRFSQSEDLTVRLRNILHDYAFGPGVFRELLQNADDAGARRFAILADETTYSTDGSGLLDPRLGVWQGPAVCAFNDAVFTDADFEGICRVGASGKRADHAKIGRYGLGFNATYHLSDVVSFASRDRLCFFDPHEAHLPEGLPGLQLRLPAAPAERQRYAAQLAPFEAASQAFGAKTWPLEGALFRLPLRTAELAQRSQICRESRSFADVVEVLHELLAGAQELLLFLQSVESFEVLVQTADGEQTRRLGGASLRTAGAATMARLRAERRFLNAGSSEVASSEGAGGSAARRGGTQGARRTCYSFLVDVDRCASTGSREQVQETSAWMITARAEPSAPQVCTDADEDDELPQWQYGAVALRLWPRAVAQDGALTDQIRGQAFCFLPLALYTGLPVHVSANFALTANRRDLWRRSDDKASSHSMRRATWNEMLLQGTLPRTYADSLELLAAGVAMGDSTGKEPNSSGFQICVFWPDEAPWQTLLRGTCPPAELWACWPASSGSAASGAFAPISDHTVVEIFKRNASVLWIESQQRYAGGKSALLCSSTEYATFEPGLNSSFSKLRVAGSRRNIVEVPANLCSGLSEVKDAVWLQPQTLATALRSVAPPLEVHEADAVVSYLLSGGGGPLTVLHGVFLAPLVGGGLGRFEKPGTVGVEDIWWTEDIRLCELLPRRKFLDPASGVFRLLKPRIANAPLNIRLLNAKALQYVLPAVLPPAWRGKRVVTVTDGVVYVDGESADVVQASFSRVPVPAGGRAKANHVDGAAESRPAKAKTKAAQKSNKKGQKTKPGRANVTVGQWDDDSWLDDEWGSENWTQGGWQEEQWTEDTAWNGQLGDGEEDDDAPWQRREAEPKAPQEEEAFQCLTVEDLDRVVRCCELLWRIVEHAPAKGTNPELALSDMPCVAVAQPDEGAPHSLRLLSVNEAASRRVLAVEDFPSRDRAVLEACGLMFVRPGKRLRSILNIEKASTLSALQAIFADRWSGVHTNDASTETRRLLMGLKPYRLPLSEARPLRELVLNLLRKNLVQKDLRPLEALPIFETQGGRFAVPLSPASARIMSPHEDWDEALRPHFADYLISWEGEAGEFLAELGKEHRFMGTSSARFLAEFAAPRAGLFDQDLAIRFLEAVAALGNAPWKKTGVPKELAVVADACVNAPVVVFPSVGSDAPRRCRISELTDPGDAAVGNSFLGSFALAETSFPPDAYCGPLVLSVLRKAGLRSLSDDGAFLQFARAAEASAHPAQLGAALLRNLAERWESLKWPSKAYTALGKMRIFPSLNPALASSVYPPASCSDADASARVALSLDGPCTVFRNADLAWTQLSLLDPDIFDTWPAALLRKFGALKDPLPLEIVTANLTEVSTRWAAETSACTAENAQMRQSIVGKHLAAFRGLSKRSHATQMMVQQQLGRLAFLVMDDGSMVKPSDVFSQLHSGGDSDNEEDAEDVYDTGIPSVADQRKPAADATADGGHKGKRKDTNASPWQLPLYLRPFRRFLLSIAGPAVNAATKKIPSIRVCPAPEADSVPKFLQNSLNDPKLADVEFVLVDEDGKERHVFAHRLILAASCEHFHAAFTSGYADSVGVGGRCIIELPDWVTSLPLFWLLAYLYLGFDPHAAHLAACRLASQDAPLGECSRGVVIRGNKLQLPKLRRDSQDPDIGNDICSLLRLADLYGLMHLKHWCEQRLHAMLNPENLLTLSTHAFFCNASQLLALCVYHMQHLYGEIAHTAEWHDLEPAIRDLVLEDSKQQDTASSSYPQAGFTKGDGQ